MAISETQINDDGYEYNPEAQRQKPASGGGNDITLMPGVYKFNVLSAKPSTYYGSEDPVIRTDARGNEFPTLQIVRVEVIEPADEGGAFGVFHDIETLPTNYGKENQPLVSKGAEVLTAIDAEAAAEARSFSEAAQVLQDKLLGGPVQFSAATGLEGYDKVWADAQIKKLGPNPDKAKVRQIRKDAKMTTKAFQISKGKFATVAKSPYGNMVKAKMVFKVFIPSNAEGVEYGEGKFAPRS